MATQEQLEAEPWWDREIITSPMVGVGLQLRAAYNVGASSFGIKGNTRHLSGGHRSQEWLKNSAYCENRAYTVQSGLTATQARMCVAFDFTPAAWGSADNRAKMKTLTKRLIDAMKAGALDEVDEVFGTLDGVRVTGWNNDADKTISADSSHLDHVHVRLDRRYADDNAVMVKITNVMLGVQMGTVPNFEWNSAWLAQRLLEMADPAVIPAGGAAQGVDPAAPGGSFPNELAKILRKTDSQAASNGSNLSTVLARLGSIEGRLTQIENVLTQLANSGGGAGPTQAQVVAWVKQALREGAAE